MPLKDFGYRIVRDASFMGSTRPVTQSLTSMTLLQQEYGHDVVSMVSYRDDNAPNRYSTGTPLTISWGLTNYRVEVFTGYVHHSEPIMLPGGQPADRQMVKVVCVGASWLMKEQHRRIFNGRTIPSVIKEVLDGYRLSGQVTDDTRVWDSLAQAGESDWEFICALAKRLGWAVYPNNTDVAFRDRRVSPQTSRRTAKAFTAPGVGQPSGGMGQIITFQAIDGETTPDGGQKANRVLFGMDAMQGTSFVVTQDQPEPTLAWSSPDPVFLEFQNDTARDYAEASALVAGKTDVNRMYIQAKVEVQGEPAVRPGDVVCLLGMGAKNSGYWYVQSAEHELGVGSYTTHLTLGRDSRWDTGQRPDHRRRRIVRPRYAPYGEVFSEIPASNLINGTWRAAYSVPLASIV